MSMLRRSGRQAVAELTKEYEKLKNDLQENETFIQARRTPHRALITRRS